MYSHDSFLNPAASTVSKSLSTVRQKNQFWCFEWYYSYAVIKTYQQQQTLLHHLAFPVPYHFLLFSSPFLCLPSALFFPFTYFYQLLTLECVSTQFSLFFFLISAHCRLYWAVASTARLIKPSRSSGVWVTWTKTQWFNDSILQHLRKANIAKVIHVVAIYMCTIFNKQIVNADKLFVI